MTSLIFNHEIHHDEHAILRQVLPGFSSVSFSPSIPTGTEQYILERNCPGMAIQSLQPADLSRRSPPRQDFSP